LSFSRFVATPENRPALIAVQHVAECLCADRCRRAPNPLYIHGAAGTGKTHLISALTELVIRRSPQLVVNVLQAAEFESSTCAIDPADDEHHNELQQWDLLVVEDLQHLGKRGPAAALDGFSQLFDTMLSRRRQLVFTANAGPGRLPFFSGRLASRLASGLVVGMEPLGPPSRLALLQDKAQRRQLAVSREVLVWLAEHLRGGVRQLEGAVLQLETLTRLQKQPLDVAAVAAQFRAQLEGTCPTIERIVQRVGSYFQIEPRRLQSQRRYRQILLPRQVGMYLARRLTGLSLGQIGSHFGDRDHSTVLHACRKIERILPHDAVLSGAVRQLQADLC
jgi:chromosomal replication initiator protein